MKLKCLLALVGIGTLLYLGARHFIKRFAQGISFEKIGAKLGAISINGLAVAISLTFKNENTIHVTVESFDGSLLYADRTLADLKLSAPTQLAASTSTDFTINSFISFLSLPVEIIDLIKSKQYLGGLSVVGTVTIAGVSTKVDYPINIV